MVAAVSKLAPLLLELVGLAVTEVAEDGTDTTGSGGWEREMKGTDSRMDDVLPVFVPITPCPELFRALSGTTCFQVRISLMCVLRADHISPDDSDQLSSLFKLF